jgi:hypothetical protein
MIAIALEAVGVWNRQLSTKHLQDFHRHGGGLVRQNANEADGGQQNGITQTVMVARSTWMASRSSSLRWK